MHVLESVSSIFYNGVCVFSYSAFSISLASDSSTSAPEFLLRVLNGLGTLKQTCGKIHQLFFIVVFRLRFFACFYSKVTGRPHINYSTIETFSYLF